MTQPKPTLGTVQLFFYCVGVIVGAGVHSIIGSTAGIAGSALWLSFLLAALVALLTGLAYAEMSTSFPHAGCEYVYVAVPHDLSLASRMHRRIHIVDGCIDRDERQLASVPSAT